MSVGRECGVDKNRLPVASSLAVAWIAGVCEVQPITANYEKKIKNFLRASASVCSSANCENSKERCKGSPKRAQTASRTPAPSQTKGADARCSRKLQSDPR